MPEQYTNVISSNRERAQRLRIRGCTYFVSFCGYIIDSAQRRLVLCLSVWVYYVYACVYDTFIFTRLPPLCHAACQTRERSSATPKIDILILMYMSVASLSASCFVCSLRSLNQSATDKQQQRKMRRNPYSTGSACHPNMPLAMTARQQRRQRWLPKVLVNARTWYGVHRVVCPCRVDVLSQIACEVDFVRMAGYFCNVGKQTLHAHATCKLMASSLN